MGYNLEEWAKIDAQLATKLIRLQKLDAERNDIINRASKLKDLTPAIRTEMENNLAEYQAIAEEVVALKNKPKGY